jgi:Uma2 family endonuclease
LVKVLIDEEPLSLKWFLCSKYFQDGGWELYKGELVAMSPARAEHELIVARLGVLFRNALGEGKCSVFGSNIGIRLWDDDSHVSPDVSICCDKTIIKDGWFLKVPEFVVEVLSKSTKTYCLGEKREIYRDFGAKEFWAVDFENRWILVENFECGTCVKFVDGEIAESKLFEEFKFHVNDIVNTDF